MVINYQLVKHINKVKNIVYPNKDLFNLKELMLLYQELENPKYLERKSKSIKSKFTKFVKYLFNRSLQNYDAMVLLSGQKGTGKSSTGIQMCRAWLSLMGKPWNPEKYIAYTNTQIMKLIDELPPFSPILCDEAINFASSENWNKPENKALKIKLGTVRTKHLFFVLCLPWKITKLDKVYLNSYVNYWVDLYGRGKSSIFIKDMNPAGDPWKLKGFQDLGAYTEFTSDEKIEKKLKKHPNFWTLCRIPKVPKSIENKYLTVRERNVYGDDTVMANVTQQDAVRALMVKALYDITLKSSTFSIKRLRKHFIEKYKVEVPLKIIGEVLEDSKQLSERIMEEQTIKNLN